MAKRMSLAKTCRRFTACSVAALAVVLAGCGGDDPGRLDDVLLVNGTNDYRSIVSVAAEPRSSQDREDFTHGILTLEAQGADVHLESVELDQPYGNIVVERAWVAGGARQWLWVSSDQGFPPEDNGDDLAPLEGYTLPGTPGDEKFGSTEVLLHLVVEGDEVAGYEGICVSFTVAGDRDSFCVEHGFETCFGFEEGNECPDRE